MEIKEMRQLPDDELRTEIEKAREKIFRMRFQGKGKDLENPGLLRATKREIARMHTVLSERKLAREATAAGTSSGGAGPNAGGNAGVKGEG